MSARRLVSMVLVWLCGVAGGLLLLSSPVSAQRLHAFSGESFGGEGTEPGQFVRPGAMAVNDATGDVYVIDRGNGRVEVFSSTGAYISQFTPPTGPFNFTISPREGHEVEGTVAVDNSTNPLDPSAGDVYVLNSDEGPDEGVVDKFSAGGTYLGEFSVGEFSRYRRAFGIAVAPNGSAWLEGESLFYEFNDANANELISDEISTINFPQEPGKGTGFSAGRIGMAIDSEGNLYTGKRYFRDEPPRNIPAKFTSSGQLIADEFDYEETSALAVDQSSKDEYVDNITSIAAFGPTSSPVERFGSGQLSESEGVAVNSTTGTVYASDAATQKVYIFPAFVVPDVSTGSVSNLGETSATVSGVVDPDGLPVSSCVFEYGTTTAYGQEEKCSVNPGSGNAPVAVSANLSGLERLTTYHFRLRVANANGSNAGLDGFFATPEPVAVSEEAVSEVSAGSALFGAVVDPEDSDTTFHFEYGTSVAYGESAPVPDGELGGGVAGERVSVRAEDLLAGTTYHVRLVASNALGVVYGPDETFTTEEGGGAFALMDGREWEMVSPPQKSGAAVEPPGRGSLLEEGLVQASEDGSAISYLANGPFSGGVAANATPEVGEQMLSRRGGGGSGPGGWSTEEISPSHNSDVNVGADEYYGTEYRMFSGDLSSALVEPAGLGLPLLSPQATEATVYLRDDGTGSYLPLVTAGNVPPGTKFSGTRQIEQEDVHPIAATPDLSHVLLSSSFALTENAKPSESPSSCQNVYEWGGGRLELVNVAEDGEATSCGGVPGKGSRGAISDDGSKVFWGDGGEALYMRDTVAERTVQVGSGVFQIANADGSMVFFTSAAGNLYVTDTLTGVTTDLTGAAGGVQGEVLGLSEDGSVVYFVATGALGGEGEEGQDNLYVASEAGSGWSTQLVAVLSGEDGPDWEFYELEGGTGGVARVSPNGRFLVFMSDRGLTGYDNRDINSGVPDEEVFLYDDATNRLVCASCNPTGERPAGTYDVGSAHVSEDPLSDRTFVWGGRWLAADIPLPPATFEGKHGFRPHQLRDLSDGGRLFFNGFDSLVSRATNGRANVYEYEPDGLGSCTVVAGCVGLISSGTSSEESLFMDASESGDDVFFLTTAKLVPQDVENNLSMYDAHVCSTAQPCAPVAVSPPACSSGDACKAAPSPQPAIFGAPASATFSGTGNLPPAPAIKAKAKPAKCRKGFTEKNGRCLKKPKPRRKRTRVAGSSRGGKK